MRYTFKFLLAASFFYLNLIPALGEARAGKVISPELFAEASRISVLGECAKYFKNGKQVRRVEKDLTCKARVLFPKIKFEFPSDLPDFEFQVIKYPRILGPQRGYEVLARGERVKKPFRFELQADAPKIEIKLRVFGLPSPSPRLSCEELQSSFESAVQAAGVCTHDTDCGAHVNTGRCGTLEYAALNRAANLETLYQLKSSWTTCLREREGPIYCIALFVPPPIDQVCQAGQCVDAKSLIQPDRE